MRRPHGSACGARRPPDRPCGAHRGDKFLKIIYPRAKNLTDNARASIHEGRLPEAFGGADRGRWSRKGATRTPASRQPKLSGPGARARASLGAHGGSALRRLPSAPRCRGPRSGGEASAPEREGSLKSNGHRGSLRTRLQTPRAGRRRNGGLAEVLGDVFSRDIAPPGGREAIRPAGPVGRLRVSRKLVCARTPVSRAALTFCGALDRKPRALKCAARTGVHVQQIRSRRKAMCEPHARIPSPGGGGSVNTGGASRGGVELGAKGSPHPDAHCVRADPPPPGEGEAEHAARSAGTRRHVRISCGRRALRRSLHDKVQRGC
jgi:hypothetical protein